MPDISHTLSNPRLDWDSIRSIWFFSGGRWTGLSQVPAGDRLTDHAIDVSNQRCVHPHLIELIRSGVLRRQFSLPKTLALVKRDGRNRRVAVSATLLSMICAHLPLSNLIMGQPFADCAKLTREYFCPFGEAEVLLLRSKEVEHQTQSNC